MLDNNQIASDVIKTPLSDALSERYLAYALSTITSRSLPDARDGLKPVHRRLLFAMRGLKLNPLSTFKKCARIVGDVMGRYHPHGDQAIYDALVRLAQDFAVRYPLIDGQGNFGNIDGDNAAAMRYTEARLTKVAELLLNYIDDESVDFRDTYDGENNEPLVLPSNFPNLLANGASGIAVGMATNIPPHNILELCDAAFFLLDNPDCDDDALLSFIKGPDFPTGAELCEDVEVIKEAYRQGKGSFRMRARWHVEKLKGGGYEIVIDEIPYQVSKSRLIEKIADLINEKKSPLLGDVRDESTDELRIVLQPKSRNVEADILMSALFKQTDLEQRFSMNMNALVDNGRVPKLLSLKGALNVWVQHRYDVLLRRTNYRVLNIERRLHLLEGYLLCFLNLDAIIHIIREEDDARGKMIEQFNLSIEQADAILNMRLRSLRKLEEGALQKEYKNLKSELKKLQSLLKSHDLQTKAIQDEIVEVKNIFIENEAIGKRRTLITGAPDIIDFSVETFIEKEPVSIVYSEKGWIRSIKGHVQNQEDIKYRDNDAAFRVHHAQTTDKMLVLASDGRVFTMPVDKLPGGRGHGEPLKVILDLPQNVTIIDVIIHEANKKYIVAGTDGRGFIVAGDNLLAQTKNGRQVLNVKPPIKAILITPLQGDKVAVVGSNRKLLIFDVAELPEMARGRGVILQKYKDAVLSDVISFASNEGLSWHTANRTRTEQDISQWLGKRGGRGKLPPHGFSKNNKFSS